MAEQRRMEAEAAEARRVAAREQEEIKRAVEAETERQAVEFQRMLEEQRATRERLANLGLVVDDSNRLPEVSSDSEIEAGPVVIKGKARQVVSRSALGSETSSRKRKALAESDDDDEIQEIDAPGGSRSVPILPAPKAAPQTLAGYDDDRCERCQAGDQVVCDRIVYAGGLEACLQCQSKKKKCSLA